MSVALIAGLLVLALIAGIAISQRAGPRVTTIETRRETEDGEKGE
ncbi:hypothetical protein GCM10023264_29210 [Sphingomonas daechungensis]|nr:hypothetical protein [Sphingomonas daechungensis]